jgi:ELWxxDGT repeat protein
MKSFPVSLLLLLLLTHTGRAQVPGHVVRFERLGGPVGGPTDPGGTFSNAVTMGGVIYFGATDGSYYGAGGELWRSDGTEAGTWIVKDINPGSAGGGTGNLTAAGDRLYFMANSRAAGTELWVSDGTEAGTRMVRDLTTGTASTTAEKFTALGTRLIFRMSTSSTGMELWASDGTAAGTVLLKDIYSGPTSSSPDNFVPAGQLVYFTATTAAQGTELWRTDGTAAGTVLVHDIVAGSGSSSIAQPALHHGVLYFAATAGAAGGELWRSDGTAAGTRMVKDIVPNTASSSPGAFASAGGKLYFSAQTTEEGRELYASDGTEAGTYRVKDINPGTRSSHPGFFTEAAGTVFFSATVSDPATSSGSGTELWKTDGTEAGTMLVRDIVPGSASSGPDNFLAFGGKVWFQGDWPGAGQELCYSDGTEAGTGLLLDLDPGTAGGFFFNKLFAHSGHLYFPGDNGIDTELYRTDGTAAGTVRVKDINRELQFQDGVIEHTVITGGSSLIFIAKEPATGREHWSTDGTPAGTGLMKDFVPGPLHDQIVGFMATGPDGLAYIEADDDLWRSDGTAAGTVPVMTEKLRGSGRLELNHFVPFGNSIFFAAAWESFFDVLHRCQTDTGAIGLPQGPAGDPMSMRLSGGRLFINPDTGGISLRAHEISPDTMTMVPVFDPLDTTVPNNGAGSCTVLAGGGIFLIGNAGAYGAEPYITSGAPGTTQLLRDIYPGTTSSLEGVGPYNETFPTPDGKVFFLANNSVNGRELWVSDGTPAGTVMVRDLYPGTVSSNYELRTDIAVVLGNRLVFSVETPNYGRELWISDGTSIGTTLVKDIVPGTGHSYPGSLKLWRDRVWFTADDGVNGEEIWVTDGTAAGTMLAADLNAGPYGSRPRIVNTSPDRLYIAAGDRQTSRHHIWQLQLAPVPSFDEWAATAGLTGADAQALANPSLDGVANLLKYAFNLNPAVTDRTELQSGAGKGLPAVTRDTVAGQPGLTVTWLRRRGAALTYTPLRSPDAQTWSQIPAVPVTTRVDDFWEQVSVTTGIPVSEAARHFGAVRVTLNP